ncbi:hypothetical protein PG996_012597 [Apiospora saccharicola]|uniref:Uncharacterized protein n=1 Tax=Apiospora saccharicola TaxID=335842 RepID=A0ABR1U312_9PEZI
MVESHCPTHSVCRQYWTFITIKPDASLIKSFHAKWQEPLGLIFKLGFHSPKKLLLGSARVSGNALVIPTDDERVFSALGSLVRELRQMADERGLWHRYVSDKRVFEEVNFMGGHGTESVDKLREVSARYRPDGVLQNGFPGDFKSSSWNL